MQRKTNNSVRRNRRKNKQRSNMTGTEIIAKVNSAPVRRRNNLNHFRPPFPLEMIVHPNFYIRSIVQGAVSFIVIDFRLNSIWQPLVSGATATVNGYASLFNIYALSHVESNRVKVEVVSNEPAIGLHCGLVFNDSQVSPLITTYLAAQQALAGPMSLWSSSIGETQGMSRSKSPFLKVNPRSFVRGMVYEGTQGYDHGPGANPGQNVWGAFILLSDVSSTNLTNGVFLDLYIEYTVRAYSPFPIC